MRAALLVATLLVLGGLAFVAWAAQAAPRSTSCSPELEQAACDSAIEAVLRRGLDSLHPLITAAHVEPGAAPGPQDNGHRATVSFDLLLVPSATEVALFYDVGAHWGGEVERSEGELAAWALAPLLIAGGLAAAIVIVAWRRRPSGSVPDATG